MLELTVWWCKSNNGKYPSRALGLGILKEQQTHYNKVYNGGEVVPPDLQVGFAYGSTNKSHALATTLGKTILIFYPGVTFSEYGRHVLQAGSGIYMKVREDGSRVTENDTDEVCFEFKGPVYRIRNIRRMSIIQSPFTIPPKCHTRWPWNTAKIASNVSFTPESSTFIMGNMSKNL